MSHYTQQFPPGLQKEIENKLCLDGQPHKWEMTEEARSKESPGGFAWEEHRWVCRQCQAAEWVAKGIKLG